MIEQCRREKTFLNQKLDVIDEAAPVRCCPTYTLPDQTQTPFNFLGLQKKSCLRRFYTFKCNNLMITLQKVSRVTRIKKSASGKANISKVNCGICLRGFLQIFSPLRQKNFSRDCVVCYCGVICFKLDCVAFPRCSFDHLHWNRANLSSLIVLELVK